MVGQIASFIQSCVTWRTRETSPGWHWHLKKYVLLEWLGKWQIRCIIVLHFASSLSKYICKPELLTIRRVSVRFYKCSFTEIKLLQSSLAGKSKKVEGIHAFLPNIPYSWNCWLPSQCLQSTSPKSVPDCVEYATTVLLEFMYTYVEKMKTPNVEGEWKSKWTPGGYSCNSVHKQETNVLTYSASFRGRGRCISMAIQAEHS